MTYNFWDFFSHYQTKIGATNHLAKQSLWIQPQQAPIIHHCRHVYSQPTLSQRQQSFLDRPKFGRYIFWGWGTGEGKRAKEIITNNWHTDRILPFRKHTLSDFLILPFDPTTSSFNISPKNQPTFFDP